MTTESRYNDDAQWKPSQIDLPSHWHLERLRSLARIYPSNVDKKSSDEETAITLCNYTDVYNNDFIEPSIDFMDATATEQEIDRFSIEEGDVILTKDSEDWKDIGVPAYVGEDLPGVLCGYHLFLTRPKRELVHPKFFFWALMSRVLQFQFEGAATGVTRYGLSTHDVADAWVPLPPKSTQIEISEYIEHKIARLDTLIDKKQEHMDLLDEKPDSLITEFLTKGLDDQALLKDSGIETIGKIPAHWEVVPNRAIFEEFDERSEDGSEELLSVSHKTGVTPRAEKDVNMFEAESLEDYKRAYTGDLVINTMWAWMGAVGISPQLGVVSPSYHVYQPNELMNPQFADYFYRIPPYVAEMGRYSKGVWKSRSRLYPEEFLRMKTILPPKKEQEAIVSEIQKEVGKAEKLSQKLQTSINLLKEKRQSIITSAVTGQIDLSNWEKKESEAIV